ncbi:MFS transporter [Francisella adeliensis]|uniref:MFS transporter n=1 Tax=Francisella adeliensis TaxID=2007306 RepID=A0A2Z4XZK4_9GAMM|nr:MFS transporter [Francisella adeliensis]AXA34307.1 MFS transporter [Francisella adeliensis]MBK2084951.1 MFS transporter [Francisella adeliensis]MBK2096218.1 MFS transporter [Francisella adeliensis]QIW12553.1 MFS transporter [Francisella adeliensis]QIW14426.1 MFS transporter [Francisella adeliensis]
MKKYSKLLFTTLGAAFEYYDLAIYSVFAVTIGQKFFNESSSVSSTLLVFSVFIVGYLVRPLGAWGFGYLADKKGRAFILRLNMFLLFFSTLALAFLPTVEHIGILATVLFVSLRCIQSLAIGAEIPVSVIYIVENYPKRKGLVTSLVFCCLSIGIMMTSLVLFLLYHYTSEAFIDNYGWRIGFFLGAVFTFILFFLRRGIVDLPQVILDDDSKKSSFGELTQKIAIGIALVACIAMLTTQLYMFLPTFYKLYLNSKFDVSGVLLSGSIIMAISCVIGGYISDYVCRTKMFVLLVLLSLAITPLLYKNILLDKNIYSCFIVMSIIMGFFASTYNVLIPELFRYEYKCRGYGLAYNLGYLVFSSGVPALTIYLVSITNSLMIPVYMVVFAGVVSLVGVLMYEYSLRKKVVI